MGGDTDPAAQTIAILVSQPIKRLQAHEGLALLAQLSKRCGRQHGSVLSAGRLDHPILAFQLVDVVEAEQARDIPPCAVALGVDPAGAR